ncbi:MAG TPA: hypothetical protein VGC54_04145 [Planctomycetota bacterium]
MKTFHRLLPALLPASLLLCGGLAAQDAKPAAKITPPVKQQGPTQAELIDLAAAKLAKDFIPFGGWVTDYDQARARAKQEGKVLFVYFTRSYAH